MFIILLGFTYSYSEINCISKRSSLFRYKNL